MPSRVCTHSGEWTPSVWARVTEVLFRVRVRVQRRVERRVERISCGTYRVERRVERRVYADGKVHRKLSERYLVPAPFSAHSVPLDSLSTRPYLGLTLYITPYSVLAGSDSDARVSPSTVGQERPIRTPR